MAKRMTDTDKWKKRWIRNLSTQMKLFWVYLLDDCNHAGIWEVDIEVANVRLGTKLEEKEILKAFNDKIIPFDNGEKWFIPKFISFQYGADIRTNNSKVARSAMEIIVAKGLLKYLENPSEKKIKASENGLQTIKNKNKDINKNKDKEKEKEKNKDTGDEISILDDDDDFRPGINSERRSMPIWDMWFKLRLQYDRPPVTTMPSYKDREKIRELREMTENDERLIEEKMREYLSSDHDFYVKSGWPLYLLPQIFNNIQQGDKNEGKKRSERIGRKHKGGSGVVEL